MRLLDNYFNEVISYGGFPLKRGDVITDLDAMAKSILPKNWLRLRDAGLMGLEFYNRHHPLPQNTEPISLGDFYKLTGIIR